MGDTMVVLGDWADLTPAVDAACTPNELAIESIADPGPFERVFTFRLLSGESGSLRARAVGKPADQTLPGGSIQSPTPIELHATLGFFGMPDREARLVRDVRRRLEQLSGVDVAPLPDGW